MEVIKFRLSGETAFFKKPDVNSYFYFSYGNIHKIALLGLLGAIIGLKGYNNQKGAQYPEFYKKLENRKIAIVPTKDKGIIHKKIQVFNNSVGYASKENGGNLIVKEQWLEKPSWDIYILIENNEVDERLKEYLLNSKTVYIPYLGKNDHMATIRDVTIESAIRAEEPIDSVNSLFAKEIAKITNRVAEGFGEYIEQWKYEEKLPVTINAETYQYKVKSFVYTNMKVEPNNFDNLYKCGEKTLYFF